MATDTPVLRWYRTASRLPGGRQLFSQAFRFVAPYFRTIPATVREVEPGRAVVDMRHLPWVRNHLGTVHAIALCNLAELSMGLAAEATVPPTQRWIPKGMEVAYRARRGAPCTPSRTSTSPRTSARASRSRARCRWSTTGAPRCSRPPSRCG